MYLLEVFDIEILHIANQCLFFVPPCIVDNFGVLPGKYCFKMIIDYDLLFQGYFLTQIPLMFQLFKVFGPSLSWNLCNRFSCF